MTSSTRTSLLSTLDTAIDTVLILIAFGVPLLVLPVTSEFFVIGKHLVLFTGAVIALALWSIRAVVAKRFVVTVSPILLPFFLLVVGYIISGAITTPLPGWSKALVGRFGIVLASLLLFIVASSRSIHFARRITKTLVAVALVLSMSILFSFTGVFAAFEAPGWMLTRTFTPIGSMANLVIVLASMLPIIVVIVSRRKKGETAVPAQGERVPLKPKQIGKTAVSLFAVVVTIAGTAIAGILLYPEITSTPPVFLPWGTGWHITVETLKENLILGVGPGRYLAAFTRFRPITMNLTDSWNQRFLVAPNELLHTFTETGLVGLLALLFLFWKSIGLIRSARQTGHKSSGADIALLVLLLSSLLTPLNVVTMTLLVLTAALTVIELRDTPTSLVWDAQIGVVAIREGVVRVERTEGTGSALAAAAGTEPKNVLPWITLVPSMAIAGVTLYFVSRVFAGEVTYHKALVAIVANDGTAAYNHLIETIRANPWLDTYHRQYADVNLRLANSLASRPNLSDQDRTNVSRLIQQAIRESRTAATMDPTDVRNWETMANIYRALINVAQGAQDFTLLTFSEAVRRDPANPRLRLELGGVFYGARDFENAIRNFQTAVSLKPNYGNGYYNLSLAYEQSGRLPEAIRAIQATIQNVDANSPDYQLAQAKLNELLKKAQPEATGTSVSGSETTVGTEDRLSAPAPLPTAAPGANRVTLDKEETPPITPQPTASPTPRP